MSNLNALLGKYNRQKVCTEDGAGIVYLLYMWIDDVRVVKIGVTGRKVEERVVEILTSYWTQYRVFPKLYPKRFKTTNGILAKEQMLHKYFADRKYVFDKRFDGCTEYFVIEDDEELLAVYEDCLLGVDVNGAEYKALRKTQQCVECGVSVGCDGERNVAEMGVYLIGVESDADEEN